jgi:GNAT superfamily N-acetyltransferase
MIEIRDYTSRYRSDFKSLNLQWIEEHFTVEPSDASMLDDPESSIIDRGGYIFVAVDDDQVVGVCSLVPASAGSFQLAKMAVSPSARGRGIGRLLGGAAIDRARSLGAPSVELFSNTVLAPAIKLYESLGFREVELKGSEHVRSNIRMVLSLHE